MTGQVRDRLNGYAGLTAIIGASKVFRGVVPQGTVAPYCVVKQVSDLRSYTFGGASGLDRPRIQISCFSLSYGQAKAMAVQVVAALEGWSGVQAALKQNEIDLYEQDTKLHHVPVDFHIWD